MPRPKFVNIRRAANLIRLTPDMPNQLADLRNAIQPEVTYTLKEKLRGHEAARAAREGRSTWKFTDKFLARFDNGSIICPAGLTHRICKKLLSRQWDYQLVDLRGKLLPEPRLDLLPPPSQLRYRQGEALASVFCHDGGVIEGATGYGKTFLIRGVCQAYPETQIIVATARAEVAKSIYKRLKPFIPEDELGLMGAGGNKSRRVTVSTLKSLGKCNLSQCRLFMCDECHEAAAPTYAPVIARINEARMFGFSASPEGRHDGKDLLVEAMFGPKIFVLPYDEAQDHDVVAKINVHMVVVQGDKIDYTADVARQRHGLWRNSLRNRMIAAVASHPVETLLLTEELPAEPQILILVDKVEHGLRIRKLLPDWTFVYAGVSNEQRENFVAAGLMSQGEGLSPQLRDDYREKFESGQLRRAIATGVWNTGVDFVHLDILIRADGGSGEIGNTQLPGRLSRGELGILVDFMDSFDESFERRSKVRRRSYKNKKWDVRIHPWDDVVRRLKGVST